MERPVKIIVARYNEDLSWMEEPPFNKFRYIVYNKGINDDFEKCNVDKIIQLPNCDNVQGAIILGNQVIVDKSVKVDDIGIYFPLLFQLG